MSTQGTPSPVIDATFNQIKRIMTEGECLQRPRADMVSEIVASILGRRDAIIEEWSLAWMAQTGYHPDQVELCEMHDGANVVWQFRPLPGEKPR